MFLLLIIILILMLGVIFWQISTLVSISFGAQYVYSQDQIIYQALKFANLKKEDNFIELGSGYGRGLLVAQKFHSKITGIEISPFHYLISKILTFNKTNIQIKYGDFCKHDLSRADLIYCYLLPQALAKLSSKFKQELKPGARVISYAFKIEGFKIAKTKQVGKPKLYLYRF